MEVYSDNKDEQLLQAYKDAIYELSSFALAIKIGEYNLHLAEFMIDNNISAWAFLTAENPQSRLLPDVENAKRQLLLEKELQAAGYRYWPGMGKDPSGKWPGENSFMVLNIEKEMAVKIGEQFGQRAIVWGDLRAVAELVLCTMSV